MALERQFYETFNSMKADEKPHTRIFYRIRQGITSLHMRFGMRIDYAERQFKIPDDRAYI